MKKILHVIHGLSTGGAETLVKEYALRLDKDMFDVVILCLHHEKLSPYEALLLQNKVKVYFVDDYMNEKKLNKKGKIIELQKEIKRISIIKKILKNEKPDIIHCHLNVCYYVFFSNIRAKVLYHVHTTPEALWMRGNLSYFEYIRKKIDFLTIKIMIKKNRIRFIVLQENMRLKINSIFNVKDTIVLNNGIDIDKFSKATKYNRFDFNIPENAFVLGHVGRFFKPKNHSFIVDVFSKLKEIRPESFLLLVGNGTEKDNIIKKLHNLGLEGSFLILSNRLDIAEIMKMMDAFIFPSIYEGLGIVAIEAQTVGIPCFVSDSVPNDIAISNILSMLSLNWSEKEWCDYIVNYRIPDNILIDNDLWNINKTIEKLEKIYMDEI